MFRSLMNVRPSHMLDHELFDFAGLVRRTAPEILDEKDNLC
jgi:tRNA 2-thiocytidine biosynthesis protein TtcA